MNLAPLLAELAGLRALPAGLLQSAQQLRLETVRSALALAQHILPGGSDELPRIRVSVGEGVYEGRVLGCCPGSLQFRLAEGVREVADTVVLVHFTDGRPPQAIRGDIHRGPASYYWRFVATDGALDEANRIFDQPRARKVESAVALAL